MHSTSDEAQGSAREAWVAAMRDAGEAAPCPVCAHMPALREYVFTATMALAMIHLYRRGGSAAVDSIPEVVSTGESLRKLEIWGLIEQRGDEYQLTEEGHEVVVRRMMVPRQCMTANGQAAWFSGEKVWINDILSQRFSYEDLMAGVAA